MYKTGGWGIQAKTYQKGRTDKLRQEIVSKFGNKCASCGFGDIRALQIDHINGGGSADRKLYRVNAATYYKRVLASTDDEFQILCANCNWIKRYENKEDIKKEKK